MPSPINVLDITEKFPSPLVSALSLVVYGKVKLVRAAMGRSGSTDALYPSVVATGSFSHFGSRTRDFF